MIIITSNLQVFLDLSESSCGPEKMTGDDLRAECPCKEFNFEKCPECPKSTNLSDDHATCIREDMVPPGADHTNSPAVCACCSAVIEESFHLTISNLQIRMRTALIFLGAYAHCSFSPSE